MSKKQKIVAIIFGILVVGGFTLASLQKEELKCSKDTVTSLEKLQEICANEIKANKESRENATKRNNEIRKMMGWSDDDLASLGLIETK